MSVAAPKSAGRLTKPGRVSGRLGDRSEECSATAEVPPNNERGWRMRSRQGADFKLDASTLSVRFAGRLSAL